MSRGSSIESKAYLQRPITVEAQLKTDGTTECIGLTLFAENRHKNSEIALEIGAWGTKWRFFPGDNQGEMGSVDDWRKVKLELNGTDGVNFYIDGDLKYSNISAKNAGRLRFIAGCQSMRIRKVRLGKFLNL